jgi:hypothetical protein
MNNNLKTESLVCRRFGKKFALNFYEKKGQKSKVHLGNAVLRVEMTQFSSCDVLKKQKIDHVLSLGVLSRRQRGNFVFFLLQFSSMKQNIL